MADKALSEAVRYGLTLKGHPDADGLVMAGWRARYFLGERRASGDWYVSPSVRPDRDYLLRRDGTVWELA